MKITFRIAALVLLIGLSAFSSDTGAKSIRPSCICPDVYDPFIDATGQIFSNGCFCQCYSTQPNTCVHY
jgi:hypothetical protein